MEIKHTSAGGNLFIKIDYENSGVKFQMKKENIDDMKLIGINEVFLSTKLMHTLAEEHIKHNELDIEPDEFIKQHMDEFREGAEAVNKIIVDYINEANFEANVVDAAIGIN